MKVSIITVTFNGAKTIAKCIDSVRSQNYSDIEHIIVDGGSTDGTVSILKNSKLRFISERDCGIYDAMNKGIELATGDIIGILNSDDYLFSNEVISKIVELIKISGVDLVHGKVNIINSDGSCLTTQGADQQLKQLIYHMKIAHPSVYLRREVYSLYGKFSVGYRIAADYDFLLRIIGRVKVAFLNEPLVSMLDGGVSSRQVRRSLREAMAVRIVHGMPPATAYINYLIERIRYRASILSRNLKTRLSSSGSK